MSKKLLLSIIAIATFVSAFLSAVIFAPHSARVQPPNKDVQYYGVQADVLDRQQGARATFDWDACTRSEQCLKAMRAFYTESAKPAYPILVAK